MRTGRRIIHSFGVNLYALLFQAFEHSIPIIHDVVDHERRVDGIEVVTGAGKNSPNGNVFLLRVVVFVPPTCGGERARLTDYRHSST